MSYRTLSSLCLFLLASVPFNISIHRQVAPSLHAELVAFVLGGLFFSFHTLESKRIRFGFASLWALAAALAVIVSTLFVQYHYKAQWIGPLCIFAAVFFVSVVVASDRKEQMLNSLLVGLVAGALWNSVTGWFQVVHWVHNVAPFMGFFGYTDEVVGNIGHRNVYGHYLCLGALGAVWLSCQQQSLRSGFRIAAFVIAIWLTFSATLSASRAMLLYLVFWTGVALLALQFWHRAEIKPLAIRVLLLAVLGGGLQFSTPVVQSGLRSINGEEMALSSGVDNIDRGRFGARRIVEIKKSYEVFLENPLFGVGWGGFPKASFELQSRDAFSGEIENALFLHSHNIFAQMAAEAGVFGLLLVIVPVVMFFRGLRNTTLSSPSLLLVSLCLGTTAIHSLVEFPLWYLQFLLVFVVLLSLVLSPYRYSVRISFLLPALIALLVSAGAWGIAQKVDRLDLIFVPEGTPAERRALVEEIKDIRSLPGLDAMGDFVLMNYMSLRPEHAELRREIVTKQASYRPYGYMQAKLICEYGMAGEKARRDEEYRKLKNAYPDQMEMFDGFLTRYKC